MSPLYIITYDYHSPVTGRFTGTQDIDLNRHNRADIAREIVRGVPGVEKVFECSFDHPMRDITEDIARDVCELLRNRHETPDWELASWLQLNLGVYAEGVQEAAE